MSVVFALVATACGAGSVPASGQASLTAAIQQMRQSNGLYGTFTHPDVHTPDLYTSYYGLSFLSMTGAIGTIDEQALRSLIPTPTDRTYLDYSFFAASLLKLSGKSVSLDVAPIIALRDDVGSFHRPGYVDPSSSVANGQVLALLDHATATREAIEILDMTGHPEDAASADKTVAWLRASLPDAKQIPYAYWNVIRTLQILGQETPSPGADWVTSESSGLVGDTHAFSFQDLLNAFGLVTLAQEWHLLLSDATVKGLQAGIVPFLQSDDPMDVYVAATTSRQLGFATAEIASGAQSVRDRRLGNGLLPLIPSGSPTIQSTYYALGILEFLGASTTDSALVETLTNMRPSIGQMDAAQLEAWLGAFRLAGGNVDDIRGEVEGRARALLPAAVTPESVQAYVHATAVLGALGAWPPPLVVRSVSSDGRENRFALASIIVAQQGNSAFSRSSWQFLVDGLSRHLFDGGMTTLEYSVEGLALQQLRPGLSTQEQQGLKSLGDRLRLANGAYAGAPDTGSADLQATYYFLRVLKETNQ